MDAQPCLDVFEVWGPENVDLKDFVADIEDRKQFYSWSEVQSDVQGCLPLVHPKVMGG